MGEITVAAEGKVQGSPRLVYTCIADYRQHHPRFLPPNFSNLVVEEGGVGAGTIIRFRLKVGGQGREYRMRVEEPEPGRILTETDLSTGAVSQFIVSPYGDGTTVRIETRWEAARGIAGFFERRLAPMLLGRLYRNELQRLDAYMTSLPHSTP